MVRRRINDELVASPGLSTLTLRRPMGPAMGTESRRLDLRTPRVTTSVCEVCLQDCPARVLAEGDRVFLEKACPVHGVRQVLLSEHGDDYLRLDRGYHHLFPQDETPGPREDTYVFITNDCNQNCPYCLTEANRHPYFGNFDRADFEAFLERHRGSKVSLIGGEPLVHKDFLWFAARVGQSGKVLVVYTNGLGLSDEALVRDLVRVAPRLEVRMTFEGFDEEDYAHLRGRGFRERKLRALDNLERHGVPTTLGRTLVRGADPERVRRSLAALIEYAGRHDFVRGLTFQGTMALGGERGAGVETVLSVDRVMDLVVESLPIEYPREQAYLVQGMVHVLARAFDLPICQYVQTAVLFREGGQWVDLDHYVDCGCLRDRLDRRIASWPVSKARLLAGLAWDVLASARPGRRWALLRQAARVFPIFLRRYEFARIPRSVLPLLSITVCDPVFFDGAVARRCEKGVHTRVGDQVVTELCSEMAIRHVRERAGLPLAARREGAG